MANITIFGLPEQTGKTNDDVLAIVDSGNTTTSKIKVSTLLSGIDTKGYFVNSPGTNNFISPYLPTSVINSGQTRSGIIQGTGSTITHASGSNNLIVNTNTSNITSSGSYNIIVGGSNHDITNGSNILVIGGDNNDVSQGPWSQITGGEYGIITQGYSQIFGGVRNEVRTTNSGTFLGRESIINNGTYNFAFGTYGGLISSSGNYNSTLAGYLLQITGTTAYGTIAGGQSNTIGSSNHSFIAGGQTNKILSSSTHSVIVGGINNITSGATHSGIVGGSGNTMNHDKSVILGGNGLTSNEDNEVLVQNLKVSGQTSGNFYDHLSGDTFDINGNLGNLHRISMTGDSIIQLSNFKTGGVYSVSVENTASYVYTLIFDNDSRSVLFPGGVPTPTPNGLDLLVFEVHGGNILGRNFANFQ